MRVFKEIEKEVSVLMDEREKAINKEIARLEEEGMISSNVHWDYELLPLIKQNKVGLLNLKLKLGIKKWRER